MSEVIENYIRRHPGESEKEGFEGFLREERIRIWVGNDETRKERLRREFGRVWGSIHVEGRMASSPARSGPSAPAQVHQPRAVQVKVQPTLAPEPAQVERVTLGAGARKLQVMCTNCSRITVWMDGDLIACRTCGHVYDDMLQLIRVTPVGPFEFLFGEGWKGAATAGGIGVALVGLYFLLRGF